MIIVELDKWVQKNFEEDGKKAYPGKGWEKLDKRTILAKKKGWGQYVSATKPLILRNKGLLKSSWGANYTDRGASYFSKRDYGHFHHDGSGHLPERRILPTQKQFAPILRKMGLKHIRLSL